MVDFSNPATQTRITSTGLIGTANAAKPVYTPQPINMSFINTGVDKPAPDWVNPDKELAEQKQMQQDSIDLQKAQFAASMEQQNKALELSYYQYALAMKNSNKKSGKRVCCAFYAKGFMKEDIFLGDQRYGNKVFLEHPDYQEWYQSVAPWYLDRMNGKAWKNILFTKILWLFVNPMSKEMSYRIGHTDTHSVVGSFMLNSIYWYYSTFCKDNIQICHKS
jgi:hypothetical protein